MLPRSTNFALFHDQYLFFPGLLCLKLMIEKTGHEFRFKMADGRIASQALQKFSELEELAQEIIEDKHQVKTKFISSTI